MKRLFLLSACLVLACSLILSACSKSSGSSDKGTVNVGLDEASWTKDIETMGKAIEQKNGVGFKVTTYPDTTTYQTTMKQSLSTKDAPGMFKWWSGYRMEDLVKGGLLADLTSTWDKFKEQGVNPDLANAFKFDGKVYGIPMTSNYWVIYYNKNVFQQNNLQPPKTWDEFLALCEALKGKGVAPLAQSTEGRWPGFIWFEELLTKYDPKLYEDLMVGKAKYTDPGVVEVMKIWKSLYDKGYFSKPVDWQTTMASEFSKGNIAMFAKGDWYQNFLTGAGMSPDKDYGVFILPAIRPEAGKSIIFEAAPLLISEKSKDKNLAIKAATAIMEKDIIGPWAESKGIAPVVGGIEVKNPVTKQLVDTINNDKYKLINRYWEATPTDICEFAVDQFVRFMLKPDEYMDVLTQIQKKADEYWSSHK